MTRVRRWFDSSRAGWGPVKDTPRSSAGRARAPQNHRGTFGHSGSLSATLSKPGDSCHQNLCSIFGGGFADIPIIRSALAGRSASGRIQANRSRPTSVGADFFDWGRMRRLTSAAAIARIPASLTEEKRAKGRVCCPNRAGASSHY